MTIVKRVCLGFALTTAVAWLSPAQQRLPDAPGRETVQKLCGTCHSANIVLGRGMTRSEWNDVVTSMIGRGAKGTPGEFAKVIDYLTANLPPNPVALNAPRRRGGGGGLTQGPNDKQIVDEAAVTRGRASYNASCASCHGPDARGTAKGADLVRSVVIMHDRYGSGIGPFLRKGHPTPGSTFTDAQIKDLSHFLHFEFNDTLRGGTYSKVLNVLTGNAQAGAAYFNGAGGCSTCHSPTGDLAGVASRFDPPTLQQRLLFPQTAAFGRRAPGASRRSEGLKTFTITVTPRGGEAVSGVPETLDDFNVSLRDSKGEYHSWKRTPELKIEKHDPYAGHVELLEKYTDKDIHDVVAYLETLK